MGLRALRSEDARLSLLSGDGASPSLWLTSSVRPPNLTFVAIVADDQCWGITHTAPSPIWLWDGHTTRAIRFDQLAEITGRNR